jgi:hypothetical protein
MHVFRMPGFFESVTSFILEPAKQVVAGGVLAGMV